MAGGEWLDPEPPHSAHSEVDCRRSLPTIRHQDIGRRFRCGICGRAYRANAGNQREPDAFWTRHQADDRPEYVGRGQ